jgi:hypothetical protein
MAAHGKAVPATKGVNSHQPASVKGMKKDKNFNPKKHSQNKIFH